MPEISRFFGIVIQMFYEDHAPPHFHAKYAEQTAAIAINTLAVLKGAWRDVRTRDLGMLRIAPLE